MTKDCHEFGFQCTIFPFSGSLLPHLVVTLGILRHAMLNIDPVLEYNADLRGFLIKSCHHVGF